VLFQNLGVAVGRSAARATATRARCLDNNPDPNNPDPYALITNCPDEGVGYATGGPGGLTRDREDRVSLAGSLTRRLSALGHHEFKLGGDVEDNRLSRARLFSGGALLQNYLGAIGRVYATRWVQLAPATGMAEADPRFDNRCVDDNRTDAAGNPVELACDFLAGDAGDPGTEVVGKHPQLVGLPAATRGRSGPNLTINAGLRYEEQRLRYAERPARDGRRPDRAHARHRTPWSLRGMFAPRLGVIYDWTRVAQGQAVRPTGAASTSRCRCRSTTGRSAARSSTTSRSSSRRGDGNQCGADPPTASVRVDGNRCLDDEATVPGQRRDSLFGSSGVLVAPGLQAPSTSTRPWLACAVRGGPDDTDGRPQPRTPDHGPRDRGRVDRRRRHVHHRQPGRVVGRAEEARLERPDRRRPRSTRTSPRPARARARACSAASARSTGPAPRLPRAAVHD
jgi:hypothetical protein